MAKARQLVRVKLTWKYIELMLAVSIAELWTAVFGKRQNELGGASQARRGLDEYRFMSLTCRNLVGNSQDGLALDPNPSQAVKLTLASSCPWHKLQTRK